MVREKKKALYKKTRSWWDESEDVANEFEVGIQPGGPSVTSPDVKALYEEWKREQDLKLDTETNLIHRMWRIEHVLNHVTAYKESQWNQPVFVSDCQRQFETTWDFQK